MTRQPDVDRLVPPVVLNIGNPIVNIPGCVKMHRDNQYHNNGLPIDKGLVENDPDQAMTVCDADVKQHIANMMTVITTSTFALYAAEK